MYIIRRILVFSCVFLFLFIQNQANAYELIKSKPIAIIGAMDCEVNELINSLKNKKVIKENNYIIIKGKLNGKNIVVSKSGVGKVSAGITTQYIIDKYKPKYIINFGIAGALTKNIKHKDVIIATSMIQHDFDLTPFGYTLGYMSTGINPNTPTVYYSDKNLTKYANEILMKKYNDINVKNGILVSGDKFVIDYKQKQFLNKTFNAFAVDMESAAIAQCANKNNIPVLIIRVISDLSEDSVQNYNNFEAYYAGFSAQVIKNIINVRDGT